MTADLKGVRDMIWADVGVYNQVRHYTKRLMIPADIGVSVRRGWNMMDPNTRVRELAFIDYAIIHAEAWGC
jgi:hypothetical protein